MQKEEASEHYIDKDAGEYKKIFPLVKYSFPVDLKCSESIEKSLNSNIWYKNSNIKKRAAMIQKLQSFDRIVSQLLDLIQGKKTKLMSKIFLLAVVIYIIITKIFLVGHKILILMC